jgi:S1-C subfamily serine protease
MVTRHFGEPDGTIFGVELSTPGLKGQSGGPLFNANGIIYGMQSQTNHLHLGFDMKNFELLSEGKKVRVTNQPFLHVGMCVHVDVIKNFLRENGVNFTEA